MSEGEGGRLICTCGHAVDSFDQAISVAYASEDCDAIEGFMPVVEWVFYCTDCAGRAWLDPEWQTFGSTEESEAWLTQAARKARQSKERRPTMEGR